MSGRRSGVDRTPTWYEERCARHTACEVEAWNEYLRGMRSTPATLYTAAEPLAWRRLRRRLAELAHDRRRDEFEYQRQQVDEPAYRLAG